MCSFNVSSLFTNVPLDETITICADTLYNNPDSQPCIPKEIFVELLHSAISTVEFSFDNTIYRQIDRVAMGSSLGPALAIIFVGYYEKLFAKISKPRGRLMKANSQKQRCLALRYPNLPCILGMSMILWSSFASIL